MSQNQTVDIVTIPHQRVIGIFIKFVQETFLSAKYTKKLQTKSITTNNIKTALYSSL